MNQIDQSSIPFYQHPNINTFLKTIQKKTQCHFVRFNENFAECITSWDQHPRCQSMSLPGWDTTPGSERFHWWGRLPGRQDDNLNHCQVSTSTTMKDHLKLIIWIIDMPHQDPNPKAIIKKHLYWTSMRSKREKALIRWLLYVKRQWICWLISSSHKPHHSQHFSAPSVVRRGCRDACSQLAIGAAPNETSSGDHGRSWEILE